MSVHSWNCTDQEDWKWAVSESWRSKGLKLDNLQTKNGLKRWKWTVLLTETKRALNKKVNGPKGSNWTIFGQKAAGLKRWKCTVLRIRYFFYSRPVAVTLTIILGKTGRLWLRMSLFYLIVTHFLSGDSCFVLRNYNPKMFRVLKNTFEWCHT